MELPSLSKFTVKSDGTLFGIDWDTVRKTNSCPLGGNRLYPMLNKPYIYCRSKKHKRRDHNGCNEEEKIALVLAKKLEH